MYLKHIIGEKFFPPEIFTAGREGSTAYVGNQEIHFRPGRAKKDSLQLHKSLGILPNNPGQQHFLRQFL